MRNDLTVAAKTELLELMQEARKCHPGSTYHVAYLETVYTKALVLAGHSEATAAMKFVFVEAQAETPQGRMLEDNARQTLLIWRSNKKQVGSGLVRTLARGGPISKARSPVTE